VKATGWACGSITECGGGVDIRVSHRYRDAHFDRAWGSVTVVADGRKIEVPLSSSFWRRCSELRSREIGAFLLSHGLAPWPKGGPPRLELVPEGDGRFRLEKL
jgi:hypothetical protein